jgi:hypothetical protein
MVGPRVRREGERERHRRLFKSGICKENPKGVSGDLGERDSVAEVVELSDELVAPLVGVGASGEPVAAEVFVVAVLGEEMPADDEDRVADRDGGPCCSRCVVGAARTGGEVGVFGVRRGDCRFVENLPEPATSLRGLAKVFDNWVETIVEIAVYFDDRGWAIEWIDAPKEA